MKKFDSSEININPHDGKQHYRLPSQEEAFRQKSILPSEVPLVWWDWYDRMGNHLPEELKDAILHPVNIKWMKNAIYTFMVEGQDILIAVRRVRCPEFCDQVEVIYDFRKKEERHERLCRKFSKEFKIPYPVVSAIGPDYAEEFFFHLFKANLSSKKKRSLKHELLDCGISRRRIALWEALDSKAPEEIWERLCEIGQKNSKVLANFVTKTLDRKAGENPVPTLGWVAKSDYVPEVHSFQVLDLIRR